MHLTALCGSSYCEKRKNSIAQMLLVMRLIILFLIVGLLKANASSYSQTVTLSERNVRLEQIFKKIEKQTHFFFWYENKALKDTRKVSVDVQNASLERVLDECLANQPLTYVIIDKTIVVKERKQVMTAAPVAIAPIPLPAPEPPTIKIRGTVSASEGQSLSGAYIKLKGSNKGTTAGNDGSFTLEIPEQGGTLVISYVGYQSVEIRVSKNSVLNIVLEQQKSNVDEIVVVGYATQRKANLTGATDKVGAKEFESRPINNIGSALQGLIANLNITTSDGRPNTASALNIRGRVSVNGGEPLILVDNIPATQAELTYLNPTDVESVTVLKDAASAAIYGARASFGVILVTTKSGKNNKLNVTVNAYSSYRTVGKLPEVVTDPYTSITLKNQAAFPLYNPAWPAYMVDYAKQRSQNPSLSPVIVNPSNPNKYLYMGNTNWLQEGYNKSAPSQDINLSLSQKTDKLAYYFSMDYYNQDGIIRYNPDSYKRYNMRGKVDFNVTPWLTFSNNTSFANILYNSPTYLDGNYFWNLNRQSSYDVPKNPDGTWTSAGASQLGSIQQGGRSDSRLNDYQSTFSFNASILKNIWSIKGDATFKRTSSLEKRYEIPVPYTDGPNGPVKYAGGLTGSATNRTNNTNYNVYNIYTDAHKKFGNHFLSILAGFNQEERSSVSNSAVKSGLISYNLPTVNLSTGTMTESETIREWAVQGYFGRLNYNFKDRYLLELDGRYDGSSRFPRNDRWGFFPSASAGWVISEESFFGGVKKATGIDFLKFRASYGSLGNQASVSEYGYIPTMNFTQQIGQILGSTLPSSVNPPGAVSPSYTWEKVNTTNFGADLLMLDKRLEVNFDVYSRVVNGMLVAGKTLPAVFGTSVPQVNAGDMKTKGFELKVSWHDKTKLGGSDFYYNFTAALANSRAWITRFDNPTNSLNNYYKGQEIGEIWGLGVDGFFKTQAEINAKDYSAVGEDDNNYTFSVGDIKFTDRNNDGKLNFGKYTVGDPGDLYKIGNAEPHLPYSFEFTGAWRGIDLRIFMQGIAKRDWYPGASNIYFWGIYAQPWTNVTVQNLDHWTPDNPNAYFPRVKAYAAEDNGMELAIPNTHFLQNASYLRCKNLTIGYTLPASWLRKARINKLRFYASAENLFEFSHLKATLDPEALTPHGDIYPFQRTYAFGLNLNF